MRAFYTYPPKDSLLGDNHLWVTLTPMVIDTTKQVADARWIDIPATPSSVCGGIKMLMPDQFAINLSHQWKEYESMAARLAEILSKYYSGVNNIEGIFRGAVNAKSGWAGVSKALGQNTSVIYTRVDSPLVYKTSTPIEYNLQFEFIANNSNDASTLIDMVKALMELSCPQEPTRETGIAGSLSNVKVVPPHLFKVTAGQMLNMKLGAITNIQPTFGGPYRDGTSFKVGLSISIVDVSPLFARSITGGNRVTTGSVSGAVTAPVTMVTQFNEGSLGGKG